MHFNCSHFTRSCNVIAYVNLGLAVEDSDLISYVNSFSYYIRMIHVYMYVVHCMSVLAFSISTSTVSHVCNMAKEGATVLVYIVSYILHLYAGVLPCHAVQ